MLSTIAIVVLIAATLDALTFRFAIRMNILRWRARRVVLVSVGILIAVVFIRYSEVIINALAIVLAFAIGVAVLVWVFPRLNAYVTAIEAEARQRREDN